MIRTTHNRIFYLIKGKDLRNTQDIDFHLWNLKCTIFYSFILYLPRVKKEPLPFYIDRVKGFMRLLVFAFVRCIWFFLSLNKDMNVTVWYFKTTLIFVILCFHTYSPRTLRRIRTKQLMSSSIRSPAPQKYT